MADRSHAFLRTLAGEVLSTPPIWFMRQAGRYLPEYRAVRAEAGSFLDLCYDPEKAALVTLQPIDRYDLDAAILFADILLIPQALGLELTFVAGEGPRLSPALRDEPVLPRLGQRSIHDTLSPVYETVKRVRAGLNPEKALIGFAGAPWTVATYMIAGQGSKAPSSLRRFAYDRPGDFAHVMELLTDATVDYLLHQAEAGADALQLFDSWAADLPEDFFRKWCLEPAADIARRVKAETDVPFIAFPRGAGPLYRDVAAQPAIDAVSIDGGLPWNWAREELSPHAVVQGGFDQHLVVTGGEGMTTAARALIDAFRGVPYVFNLGHGFVPETDPNHVAALVETIRSA